MECRVILLVALVAVLAFSGCFTLSSPGARPLLSPAPTVAAPLILRINATPARYNPAMSSTIGIRLTPVNVTGILPPDAVYTWETPYGTFYHWGPPDFKVIELGPAFTGTSGPVFWSYFAEPLEKERSPVTINLGAADPFTGTVLGNTSIRIGWEDPAGLTAVVEGPARSG